MSHWITSLVEHVVRQRMPPKSGGLWTGLGVPVVRTETSGDMEYFQGALDAGPFTKAELRVNRATGFALLVLAPRDDAPIREADLALDAYGPSRVEITPDISPEGATTLVFEVNGVTVRFQLTTDGRVLRVMSFTWPARALHSVPHDRH